MSRPAPAPVAARPAVAPTSVDAVASSPASIGPAAFKLAMRSLVAGVTIVAAQDRNGFATGLTASAVTSLSADPPSLLVCVNQAAAMAAVLAPGAAFSVNALAADQTGVAAAFGGARGLKGAAKFAVGEWVRGVTGAPLLAGAVAAFECVVAEVASFGTHRVVMARVVEVHAGRAASALAYRGGRYVGVE